MLYVAETELGMTLISEESEEKAFKKVRKEIGSYFDIYSIRKACDKDIAWYKYMGGKDIEDIKGEDRKELQRLLLLDISKLLESKKNSLEMTIQNIKNTLTKNSDIIPDEVKDKILYSLLGYINHLLLSDVSLNKQFIGDIIRDYYSTTTTSN